MVLALSNNTPFQKKQSPEISLASKFALKVELGDDSIVAIKNAANLDTKIKTIFRLFEARKTART